MTDNMPQSPQSDQQPSFVPPPPTLEELQAQLNGSSISALNTPAPPLAPLPIPPPPTVLPEPVPTPAPINLAPPTPVTPSPISITQEKPARARTPRATPPMRIDEAKPAPPPVGSNISAPTPSLTQLSAPVGSKSVPIAYLFWFFLGGLGAHQYYLENKPRFRWMLGLFGSVVLGASLSSKAEFFSVVGGLAMIALFVMVLIDLFTLPKQVHRSNRAGEKHLL